MPRIFFDVSDLRRHLQARRSVSGIQRVSLMVIDHAIAQAGPEDEIWLGFHDKRTKRYMALRPKEMPGFVTGSPDAFALRLGMYPLEKSLPSMVKYKPDTAKYRFHLTVRRLNAAMGNEAHFRRRGLTIADWQASLPDVSSATSDTRPIAEIARAGDQLVVLGAFWDMPDPNAVFQPLADQGLHISLMIHDLIPVIMPETVAYAHGLNFHETLRRSVEFVGTYLANSTSTASDLQTFLQTYGASQPVITVPLAQAGIGVDPADGHVPDMVRHVDQSRYPRLVSAVGLTDQLRRIWRQPYVLCVGTRDTRKNIWRLAQAWARMRQDASLELPKLVIAGGKGWGAEDFDQLMQSTGQLGGWVEIVDRPRDAELAHLYRNCLFAVMPSLYEGWGLPIGEALAYGKTVVASETSSMPEVGGDLVVYCDPHSIESIRAACAGLLSDPARRQALETRIATTKLRSWGDVATDLVGHLGT